MAKKEKKAVSIHEIKECPDCASQNLIYNEERQQVICRDCGLIYEPLAPDLEKQFEQSHTLMPAPEAKERIMIKIAGEEPKKVKKIKKKVVKKAVKKKLAKPKKAKKPKKPVKKVKKKKPKKVKKKVAKKPKKVVKKAVKKKLAKPKKAKKPAKKGIMHLLRSRLIKKKR